MFIKTSSPEKSGTIKGIVVKYKLMGTNASGSITQVTGHVFEPANFHAQHTGVTGTLHDDLVNKNYDVFIEKDHFSFMKDYDFKDLFSDGSIP